MLRAPSPAAWLVPLALSAADCAQAKFVPYEPLERATDLDEKKLYAATEGTLLDRGYLFQQKDEAGCHLVTQPRRLTGGEGDVKYRYVWQVSCAGGTLKIRVECQEDLDGAKPVSCGKETPEKIVKEQKAIADQAVKEARGE